MVRSNTQAVSVDVLVTHEGDNPVTGLKKEDFLVFEDGKPQSIDLFEEHSIGGVPSAAAEALPPHVYTNRPAAAETGPVNVILLDSLNTPNGDLGAARKQLLDLFHHLPQGERFAIFTLSTRLREVQGFTSDPEVLCAVINSKAAAPGSPAGTRTRSDELNDKEEVAISGEMSNTGGAESGAAFQSLQRALAANASMQTGQRVSTTVAALEELTRALSALPGRKNLFWFATTFPISLSPNGVDRETLANGKPIYDAMRAAAHDMDTSKVAIYPISAQGVLVDSTTNADSGGQPNGDDFEQNPYQQQGRNAATVAAMEQLATDTGGQALYTSNDLSGSMERAVRSASDSYTIVYTPTNAALDGKFHRIEIKLANGHDKLTYRRGYFADDAGAMAKAGAAQRGDPLAPLLAPDMPASAQVVYQVRVLPADPQPAADAQRAGGNAKLTGSLTRYKADFLIDPRSISLEAMADGTHAGKIELAVVAYDAKGNMVNWEGNTLGLNIPPASFAQVERGGLPLHLQIDLPAGDIRLATGVYDLNARRAGTLEFPLERLNAGARK